LSLHSRSRGLGPAQLGPRCLARRHSRCLGVATALWGLLVHAQVPLQELGKVLSANEQVLPSGYGQGGSTLAVVVEDATCAVGLSGVRALGNGRFGLRSGMGQLLTRLNGCAHDSVQWAPPRQLSLEVAGKWNRASEAFVAEGWTGRNVIVGIVDSGVDVEHRDLRGADGRTRIAWLLDLSRPPAAIHPDLEESFGCTVESPCAIYSAADIDDMLRSGDEARLPVDPIGHGTHVAALAASNGLSTPGAQYLGMAPEATLIAVRAARDNSGAVFDDDILLGTRFVFEQASNMGLPAVVNLSLGGDFGPHDGSTALERALADWVGPAAPGRAIVVAAGNGADLTTVPDSIYPGLWGLHTETQVSNYSESHLPVLVPSTNGAQGEFYLWLGVSAGGSVTVALDGPDGELVSAIGPGDSGSGQDRQARVQVFNGVSGDGRASGGDIAVVVSGSWGRSATYALRLTGRAVVRAWVQSDGALGPVAGSSGARFPLSTKAATVAIPATSASLIAVGATLNRTGWESVEGVTVTPAIPESDGHPTLDTVAWFSAAGPTTIGSIKPDLLAPGGFVVGAMASGADPRLTDATSSLFSDPSCVSSSCRVVDNHHAVAAGTSMAAPQVAGAIALLLGQEPSLTQPELLALLRAGARRVGASSPGVSREGAGALDLVATLEVALVGGQSHPAIVDARQSWFALADGYAFCEEASPLQGLLKLRASDGAPADPMGGRAPILRVFGGTLVRPLRRDAAGLWTFAVVPACAQAQGELRLEAIVDGEVVASAKIPSGADRWTAEAGYVAVAGCNTRRGSTGSASQWLVFVGIVLLCGRRLIPAQGR
jgi:subtilisin family serine protease